MARDILRQRLTQVRRWLLAIGGTAGVAWGLVGALLLLFACVWLDLLWELSPQMRIAAWPAAAAIGVVVLAAICLRSLRASDPASLARRMDAAAGSGGAILSGVDLDRQPRPESPLTVGLAEIAIERAANWARELSPTRVVSSRPARISLGVLTGCGVLVFALALLMPDLAHSEWSRFTDPFGQTPPYSLVQFTVEPGDTQVVYGKGLDIFVTPHGPPVDEVELEIRTEDGASETLPMFPEPGGRWRAALSGITQPSVYLARAHGARSREYNIGLITVPRIESVRFRITPPAYANQSPYEGPLPKDGLAGLPGTLVEMWAKSNRPLSDGAITLTLDKEVEQVPLTPSDKGNADVHGSFTITASGKFELSVTDVAGQASQDNLSGAITLLEDQRPFIRITEPKAVSLATPTATVPVLLSAEDDYGISRIEMYRSLNDSRPLPMEVQVPTPPARRFGDSVPLPLSTYGLSPGDVIKLFARVEDNDPAGAKGSESAVATIQIISQEDYERMLRARHNMEMLMSRYRQAQRRLEARKEEQEGLRKKHKQTGKPTPEMQDDLAKLAENMAREAKALREAADNPLPYDVDGQLSQHLKKLAEAMENAARDAQSLTKRSESEMLDMEELMKHLDAIFDNLESGGLQFEQSAMEPLEHLERVFPLMADQSRFVQLYQRQRELAERLASLKGRDNQDDPAIKSRMRDLEAEQRRIREELSELLDDIEQHAARLPDDEKYDDLRTTALEFVEALRDSGAVEAMSEAESALAGFLGTRAHEKATEAADILEKFLSKCQGMGDQAGACMKFSPSLCDAMGNTLAQLLADMGLGNGMNSGFGQGGGSGYSARANSAQNVGLYGTHPSLAGSDSRGSRTGDAAGQGGRMSIGGDDGAASALEGATSAQAAGAGAGLVPARYRQRVTEYFQRIAEETQ